MDRMCANFFLLCITSNEYYAMKWKICKREFAWYNLRNYTGICFERFKEKTKNRDHNIQFPDHYLNWRRTPECKAGVLSNQRQNLVRTKPLTLS